MRLIKQKHGVIMMETLLTLPIYIVMLASLFWLGEMSIIRLNIINGERLRLWENGTRHINTEKFIGFGELFWNVPNQTAKRSDIVTGVSLRKQDFLQTSSAAGWGQIRTGNMQINTRRSEWSWGISNFFKKNLWDYREDAQVDKDVDGGNILPMFARSKIEKGIDVAIDSQLLSRQYYTGRSGGIPYFDNVNWIGVANESWGNFISPRIWDSEQLKGIKAVTSYSRDGYYVDWSD